MYVPLTRLELQTDDWTDTDEQPARAAQNDAQAHLDATLSLPQAHREIRLLKERLADAQHALQDYQTLVRTQLEAPALAELEDDTPLEVPKRDDDTHYFESYCGTGASTR